MGRQMLPTKVVTESVTSFINISVIPAAPRFALAAAADNSQVLGFYRAGE
jgi:hypothetical protein